MAFSDEFETSSRRDRRDQRVAGLVGQPGLVDPLAAGRIARRQTIRATFSRVQGSVRASGRRVRQKAATLNRSLRYAANRPILPYDLLDNVDADGRRFVSEHEYLSRQILQEQGTFSNQYESDQNRCEANPKLNF